MISNALETQYPGVPRGVMIFGLHDRPGYLCLFQIDKVQNGSYCTCTSNILERKHNNNIFPQFYYNISLLILFVNFTIVN